MIGLPLHIAMVFVLGAPEVVVARVNGEAITRAALAERVAKAGGAGQGADIAGLLEDLISDELLAEDGYRLGLDKDPKVVAVVEAERRRAASERLVAKELSKAVAVTDQQLRDMYHAVGDSVRIKAVVLATQAEAQAAHERLVKGAKIEDEAQHSLDPEAAAKGGDLGTRMRVQLEPALDQVAFSSPLNQPVGPIRLELGWAVVVIGERHVADTAGFEKRKAELRRYAEAQMAGQVRHHYLAELRKQANAKVDEDFIKATGTSLSATPEQDEHEVASVAGRAIRYGKVLDQVRRLSRGREGGHASGASVKIDLAWGLVDQTLLEDAAIAEGFGQDTQVVALVRRVERYSVASTRASQIREAVLRPTAAEVLAHYQKHQVDYSRPSRRTLAHILVRDKGIAQKLKKRLETGEAWDELAAGYSEDTKAAASGGLIGDLAETQIKAVETAGEPALAAAFRDTKPGQIAGPVKSQVGWHLIRLVKTTPAAMVPLGEVKEAIVERIVSERGNQAVRDRLKTLRTKATVEIDEDALARAKAKIIKEAKR